MKLRIAVGTDFVEVEGDNPPWAEDVRLFQATRAGYYSTLYNRQAAELNAEEQAKQREQISAALTTLRTLSPQVLRRKHQ